VTKEDFTKVAAGHEMTDLPIVAAPAVEDIWKDDLLGRKADAQLIVEFITKRVEEQVKLGNSSCYVLNLDAKWGQGKSFFLTRLARQLEAEGCLATYVNAWEDDHASDPLIAVISAIDKTFKKKFPVQHVKRKAWDIARKSGAKLAVTAAKGVTMTLVKKVLDDNAVDAINDQWSDEAAELALDSSEKARAFLDKQGEEFLKRFDESKDTIVRKALTDAASVQNDGKPLFILIDELDRCRPTFSIELLERVKHLFNADRVVFIIATDTDQLRHSISAVYGAGFDASSLL
jgi:predicted KAP-like P-loop ATPase